LIHRRQGPADQPCLRGGGRKSGGDKSPYPSARSAKVVGAERASVPAAAEPVASVAMNEPPPENVATIPARPAGDSTETLTAVIAIDSALSSAGAGLVGACISWK